MTEGDRKNLADRIARDVMQENPSLAPGGSGTSRHIEAPALVVTPTNRFGIRPGGKSSLGKGMKRKDQSDDSEEDVPAAKVSMRNRPLSQRLPKSQWPSGYTAEDVDSFTVTDLLLLKQAQDKEERKSKEGLPGVVNRRIESAKKVRKVPAGVDNDHDKLHEARFYRPTGAPPRDWWCMVPESWPEKRGEQWSSVLGTSSMIPSKTFAALHDRAISLRMRHFMEKNVSVELREAKLQIRTDGDDASVEGWKKKYVGPDNLTEINNGLDNLQAALLQLWPWDYTAQVIRRVLNRYSYMVTADTMRRRVSCIEKFFDDVLDKNAKSPHLPPMGYAEAEELAKLTMERMGVPPVVGVVADYYRQVLNPGGGADRGQEDRAKGGNGFNKARYNQAREQAAVDQALRDQSTRYHVDTSRLGTGAVKGAALRAPGSAPTSTLVKGDLAVDMRHLRVGRDLVCKDYQTGSCKRMHDPKNMGCLTSGGNVAHHICSVVKEMLPGGNPRLCGGNHEGDKCKQKNP